MVVHAEGQHPGDMHDGGEMREIQIPAEKRAQADCKTCSRSEERDQPGKRSGQKECGDGTGECDVNGPGDGQGALKRLNGYNVKTEEERELRALRVRYRAACSRT